MSRRRPGLRSAAAERGYLFFPGLLPAEAVLEVRRDVLRVLRDHGALADGSETEAGIAKPGLVLEGSKPDEQYRAYYNKVLSVYSFNALPHHPRIMGVVQQLLGEAVLVHPRHICHAIFPGLATFKTPPHQDHFSVGGTPHTWTVWLPLGDCDSALGGVMLAEGSHADGLLPVVEGSIWVDPGTERRWTWSPMAAGDVVLFHSLAVHQGRDNTSGDRIRLAASFRYQPVSEPVDAAALAPQHRYAGWDELYADWPPDDPLRHYWRDLPLQVQPSVHP
jgi:ectoine hydroxylase-related dioxygenase (phytanoyl-CoA dioxygenase family)